MFYLDLQSKQIKSYKKNDKIIFDFLKDWISYGKYKIVCEGEDVLFTETVNLQDVWLHIKEYSRQLR